MTAQEKLQRETFKALLQQAYQCNLNLTIVQKQIAYEKVDRAAMQVDWILVITRTCG